MKEKLIRHLLHRIKECKAYVKKYHLKRCIKEYELDKKLTADDLIDEVDGWDIQGDDDLIYLSGQLAILYEMQREFGQK